MLKYDAEDWEFRQHSKPIFDRVVAFVRGKHLTSTVMNVIDEIVRDESTKARARDPRFPRLVAIMVPESGKVHIMRRDLDHGAIQRRIRALIDEWPACRIDPSMGIPAIARAIRRSFPEYNPDHAGVMDRMNTEAGDADQLLAQQGGS